jgi:mono/diheme cytochrome c family protein
MMAVRPRYKLSFLAAFASVLALAYGSETITHGQQSQIDFNRDIRPILADRCFACHGPDDAARKSKLRLDTEAAAKAELRRGHFAIKPGQPEQSELIHRITATDEAERMPPASSGRNLTQREISLLTEWIKQGAPWQTHWAFVKPTRPALPPVKNTAWPKNAIDYFVLARLEREGLQPAPEADRATLLRRVSLDLTGLPPTPQELDAFLNDQAPNAYEKVVDRLLSSPRYGERMAFKWLDAARYADTNGYQIDGERSMWRWRDWVIEAFNRNQPFDQFVIEQLAGDLLPNATFEQRLATAFNRNHRGNSEDGLVPEEYRIEYVVDRVDTTATVFLGLTAGCARCHNHKYDPLSQREYYQLSAYFNSIPEDGRAHNYGNSPPWMAAPTAEQQAQLKRLDNQLKQTQTRLATLTKAGALAQRRWERTLRPGGSTQWFPTDTLLLRHALDAAQGLTISGKVARLDPSKPDVELEDAPVKKDDPKDVKTSEPDFKDGAPSYVAAPTGQGVAFDGKLYFNAGQTANFDYRDRLKDYKDNFAISVWFYPEAEQSGALVTHMSEVAGEQENNLPKNRGYGLFFNNGKLHFNVVGVWADDSFRVETAQPLPLRQWHHAVAIFDSSAPYEKLQLFVNGQKQLLKINNGRLFRTFGDAKANLLIGAGGGPAWRFKGMLDEVRIYKSIPEPESIAILACPDTLEQIAAIPPARRTLGQRLKIQHAWLDKAAPLATRQTWLRLRELRQQRLKLEAEFPTVMVMQELPEPRPAYVLRRGSYDAPTEKVERAVPAIFPPPSPNWPNNRLGFARWLTSPDHPLLARVTVNRFWQMLFGTGLVRTVEDFGAQGELPSHPELLDWLAVAFRDGIADCGLQIADCRLPKAAHQWDVKQFLRLVVTSQTYRQSSQETSSNPQSAIRNPQSLDPENRLLARAPRLRLPAEMIRDQALFAAGLLVEKRGGPSVRPYQPEGLFKDMTFSNMTAYHRDKGEGLWRRSLYTFWKRTIMPPAMQVFDASAREACTVRETRTNTPLQALNLMNDVTYVEAARLLAERMLNEGGAEPAPRLAWAFRLLTARWPDKGERQILLDNLNAQLDYFRDNPQAAANLLAQGEKRNSPQFKATELAAYATTASLLLNLDEVITKR